MSDVLPQVTMPDLSTLHWRACKERGHTWVHRAKPHPAEHIHVECYRCGTRGVSIFVRDKRTWDQAWLERRDEPASETAGEPVVQRIG